jgi:hypothetical protein
MAPEKSLTAGTPTASQIDVCNGTDVEVFPTKVANESTTRTFRLREEGVLERA